MEDSFAQLNQKLDFLLVHMDEKFEAVDTRFETMDARFDAADTRFDAMDKRFDAMDRRFEATDGHFVRIETKIRDGFAQTSERSRRLDTDMTACTRRINRIESVVGI